MPSKIKTDPEPAIYFLRSADVGIVPSGDSSVNFSLGNLPAGSGQIANLYDLGPGPRTSLFEWRSVVQLASATAASGSLGSSVELYFACSDDNVYLDGNLPKTDTLLVNPDQRRNLGVFGTTTGDGNQTLITSGIAQIFSRYVAPVCWNSTPYALGPSGSLFILTPVPDELQ